MKDKLNELNMIDTLVSILTLQNAMIIAKGGMDSDMNALVQFD